MDTHEGVTYTNTSNKVGNILKENTAITNALFHPVTEYENCVGKEIQWILRILDARKEKWQKFHTEDPQKLATVQNLVVMVTWRPEFVYPCMT